MFSQMFSQLGIISDVRVFFAAPLIADLKSDNYKYDGKSLNLRLIEMNDQQLEEILALFLEKKLSSKIGSLNVQGNNLQFLPASIGEFTELWSLDISNNRLETLPETLWNCKKLKCLNVEDNCLKVLGGGIWQCLQLQKLYAAKNDLEEIPYAVGGCFELEELSLDTIPFLTTVPDTIEGLQLRWQGLLTSLAWFQNERVEMLASIFKILETQAPSDVLEKASEPRLSTKPLQIILGYLTDRTEYKELIPKSPDPVVWGNRVPESLRHLFSIYKQRMIPPQNEGHPQPKKSGISCKNAV
ncbi:MAG TPA: hypothetical protein PK583_00490 [Gammaproteobacteria bacterium]|nr:hypothetical protein [Gammaproteobacteria bacterium]HQZ88088.1 hypothetical protein [Gammaproteobacteria bacterium]HRA42790.1 hypothetical protein [Gammaproteobacteria bacterium]